MAELSISSAKGERIEEPSGVRSGEGVAIVTVGVLAAALPR